MKKSSTSTPPIKAAPLPTREGVSPSCVVLPIGPWTTIREFLVQRFPGISVETWAARIQAGEVRDEQGVPVSAERAFQPHLRVYYYRALPAEPRIPFDEVVVFHPLQQTQMRGIAEIQLGLLRQRLADLDLQLQLDDGVLDKLAEHGFDPVYGARPLKRAIQQWLENPLAQEVLKGSYPPGSTIVVSLVGQDIAFSKKAKAV